MSRRYLATLMLLFFSLLGPLTVNAENETSGPTPDWFVMDMPVAPESPEGDPSLAALMQITVSPDSGEISRKYVGAYLLRVSSGVMCFTLSEKSAEEVVVTYAPGNGGIPGSETPIPENDGTCGDSTLTCEDAQLQCPVEVGVTVQIGEGQSLSVTGSIQGTFSNPSLDVSSVLLVTDYYSATEIESCRGGCW